MQEKYSRISYEFIQQDEDHAIDYINNTTCYYDQDNGDNTRLRKLGYKQELSRGLSYFLFN